MKRLIFISFVFALMFFMGAGDLAAGSIDYLSNQSAAFVRNNSRNAVDDAADAVNYNPAGTCKMKDGLYLELNNQTVLKTFTHTYDGEDYESTEPTLLLPSVFAVYKMDNLGIMAAFTVPAGGGKVIYEDGTDEHALADAAVAEAFPGDGITGDAEGSSMYLAGTLGISYAINDMIGAAITCRYIKATKTAVAEFVVDGTPFDGEKIKLDYEDTATGFAPIFGINLAPTPELNIGIRYEMATKLEFERSVSEDGENSTLNPLNYGYAQVSDGEEYERNLPAILALGGDYAVSPELTVGLSMIYYFIEDSDKGDDEDAEVSGEGYADDYKNGYEVALGLEYRVMPELLASISYNYSKAGSNEDTIGGREVVLDSNTIAVGGQYAAMEGLDINLGFSYVIYSALENADTEVEYSRDSISIAVGVGYKAM